VKEQSEILSSKKQEIKELKERFYSLTAADVNQGKQETPIQSNEKAEERENTKRETKAFNSTDTDLQARVRGNLDLVGKVCDSFSLFMRGSALDQLEKELNKLHRERSIDIIRAEILDILGIGSWQGVEAKATESGMALRDYLIASLKDLEHSPLCKLVSSMEVTTMLSAHCSYIDPGKFHDLAEAYVSVYGQGVGQLE
jgi:hypothetical protein